MNANCFKIGGHVRFANLASFYHMDLSGLLVCHSRNLAEMNCSDFVFVAICLRLPQIEVDSLH